MPKEHKDNKNQIVYKCNSRHCAANGYHPKDECRTITLKLIIGKDCPLDFEEQIIQTVTKVVEQQPAKVVSQPTQEQVVAQKRRSAIPQGLLKQGLQMQPPPGAM